MPSLDSKVIELSSGAVAAVPESTEKAKQAFRLGAAVADAERSVRLLPLGLASSGGRFVAIH